MNLKEETKVENYSRIKIALDILNKVCPLEDDPEFEKYYPGIMGALFLWEDELRKQLLPRNGKVRIKEEGL